MAEVHINRDHLAALASMQSTLAWQILQAHFAHMREETIKAIMATGLEPEERERLVHLQAGRDDVLGWVAGLLERNRPEQVMRAGINQ